MVSICNSLMTNDIKYLLMCLLTIHTFFCEVDIQTFAFLKIGLSSYCQVASVYIFLTQVLSDLGTVTIFSQPVVCLFIFLMMSFKEQNFKILMKTNGLIFLLWFACLCSKKVLTSYVLLLFFS